MRSRCFKQRAVENMETLVDATEKARNQGVRQDFVDAFLEDIDREVSPEIQLVLAGGRPPRAQNNSIRKCRAGE